MNAQNHDSPVLRTLLVGTEATNGRKAEERTTITRRMLGNLCSHLPEDEHLGFAFINACTGSPSARARGVLDHQMPRLTCTGSGPARSCTLAFTFVGRRRASCGDASQRHVGGAVPPSWQKSPMRIEVQLLLLLLSLLVFCCGNTCKGRHPPKAGEEGRLTAKPICILTPLALVLFCKGVATEALK
eukprot:21216-Chlamydomonas_euryale.AAC.28